MEYQGYIEGREKNQLIAGVTSAIGQNVLVPSANWSNHRPKHEIQNKGYETSACLLFSGNDCKETILKYHLNNKLIPDTHLKFLKDNGYLVDGEVNYSDRLPANYADIKPLSGTFQYKANNALVEYNIPEAMLPYAQVGAYKNPDDTSGGYFNRGEITEKMLQLSKEHNELFTWSWHYVEDNKTGLLYSPLQVTVKYADGDGVLRPTGRWNHGVMEYKVEGETEWIDDSYTDPEKCYAKGFVGNYVGFKLTINEYNMDIDKFLKDNDLRFVRNEKTGQFGRVIAKKLRVVSSTDRGTLMLLDSEHRKNGVTVTDAEWNSLSKMPF